MSAALRRNVMLIFEKDKIAKLKHVAQKMRTFADRIVIDDEKHSTALKLKTTINTMQVLFVSGRTDELPGHLIRLNDLIDDLVVESLDAKNEGYLKALENNNG